MIKLFRNLQYRSNSDRKRLLAESPSSIDRLLFTIGLIAIWSAAAASGYISDLLLPAPWDVVRAAQNIGWDIVAHSLATTARVVAGLTVGAISGVFLGGLIRYSAIASKVIEPFLDASRPLPTIALLPFFILIFGFSEFGRVFLVALTSAIIFALAASEAIQAIPERWIRFPIISGQPKWKTFIRVIFPAIMPSLKGPARIALAVSFTLVIASEFMGAQTGLGYLINVARVNLATDTILMSVLLLGLIAQVFDLIVAWLFGRITRWYEGAKSASA